MTPAAARVAWTAAGEPRTENLCTRHTHHLLRLLALVNVRGLTGPADDGATCHRCPRKDHP